MNLLISSIPLTTGTPVSMINAKSIQYIKYTSTCLRRVQCLHANNFLRFSMQQKKKQERFL